MGKTLGGEGSGRGGADCRGVGGVGDTPWGWVTLVVGTGVHEVGEGWAGDRWVRG